MDIAPVRSSTVTNSKVYAPPQSDRWVTETDRPPAVTATIAESEDTATESSTQVAGSGSAAGGITAVHLTGNRDIVTLAIGRIDLNSSCRH
jgi:hypothetical protein